MICPKVHFTNKLYELIHDKIIRLSTQEIDEIYKLWQAGFENNDANLCMNLKFVSNKSKISKEQSLPISTFLLGIDFPIWFDSDNGNENKKKIMIVGVDPLRNEWSFDKAKANKFDNVIIGTPYALHSLKARNGNTKNYWGFVQGLATKHFVYLTDIYKTFFYTDILKRERSYVYYRENELVESHIRLLESEIEFIKPDLIVAFGGECYRNLFPGKRVPKLTAAIVNNIIFRSDYPVLPMVHLSGSTRYKNILGFLINNNIELDHTENYGQHYCKIIDEYLNSKEAEIMSLQK